MHNKVRNIAEVKMSRRKKKNEVENAKITKTNEKIYRKKSKKQKRWIYYMKYIGNSK